MNLRFVTSVYGQRHVNTLLPLLYSIERSNQDADISVYWEDIDARTVAMLKKTFPKVEFIETSFKFVPDVTKRISSKLLVWEFAAHRHLGEIVCFLDTDTLVIRSLADILKKKSFDMLITDEKGHFPINSGVVLVRDSPKVAIFFTNWRKRTEEILSSPTLYAQANSRAWPYGGADQMALQQLLHYTFGTKRYLIPTGNGQTIRVETIPRRILNETESRPITHQTHIIHYKGGWRSILFEGGYFTRNRPKQASWAMYVYYIRTIQDAVGKVSKAMGREYTLQDFGFSVPFYLDPETLEEHPTLYWAFLMLAWLRSIPKRTMQFIQERF